MSRGLIAFNAARHANRSDPTMTTEEATKYAHLNDGRRRKVPNCGTCGEKGHRSTSRKHHPAVHVVPDVVPCLETVRNQKADDGAAFHRQSRTIWGDRPLSKKEKRAAALVVVDDDERPKTRGDCKDGPRPCAYVSCSHHLYLDVTDDGSLKLNHPHLEPWELRETCALDVADRGPITLEETGANLGLTRERVRQIEERSLRKLRHHTPREAAEDMHDPGSSGPPSQAGTIW